jgi:hypothetical protein
MTVATMLTQQVRCPPQVTDRCTGKPERTKPRIDPAASPRCGVGGPPQQLGDPLTGLMRWAGKSPPLSLALRKVPALAGWCSAS